MNIKHTNDQQINTKTIKIRANYYHKMPNISQKHKIYKK